MAKIIKVCPKCKVKFEVKPSHSLRRKYCSMKCKMNGILKKCKICNKDFYVQSSLINKKIYCSKKCWTIGMKGKMSWNKGFSTTSKKYHSVNMTKNNKSLKYSHYIWCSQPENLSYVPKGFIIHHIDGNPKNNIPSNLFLMDKIDHHKLHNEIFRRIKDAKRYA